MLGNVRPYDPTPPAASELDIRKFPLKMATVTRGDSKKGIEKYRITLSNEIRSKYVDDVIHAPQWKELILDFDKKFLV